MRQRFLLFFIVMFAFAAAGQAHQLPGDVSEAMEWYDSLGFPDVKHLTYVRVATGSWSQQGNSAPQAVFLDGFLVSAESGRFRVFPCGIPEGDDVYEYSRLRAGKLGTSVGGSPFIVEFVQKTTGAKHERVEYTELDFSKAAADGLKRLRKAASSDSAWLLPGSEDIIFAVGRAALQKGLTDTGAEFLTFAANLSDPNGDMKSLRHRLQQAMGNVFWEKVTRGFGDKSIPLSALLRSSDTFVSLFPESSQISDAQDTARVLQRMVADEAAHQAKPAREMSRAETIAEDIYQLRNVDSFYWIADSQYPTNLAVSSPAHRLVDRGYEAVPQLIDALGDDSFTRGLQYSFHTQFPPWVTRVSELAGGILGHIAGKRFNNREEVEAWWANIQSKGEKQALVEQAAVEGQGVGAARLLVERYPEVALDVIRSGASAWASPYEKAELVALADKLQGENVDAFLRQSLSPGAGLPAQVAAAEILGRRGHTEGVPAIIAAWKALQPRLGSRPGPGSSESYDHAGLIIGFLASSGNPEAIDAMGAGLASASVDVRLAVARVFLPSAQTAGETSGDASVGVRVEIDAIPEPAAPAVQRLLVSLLRDTAEREDMEGNYDEVEYKDPRICDMAALTLARRWPEKYSFTWSPSASDRDKQIAIAREQ